MVESVDFIKASIKIIGWMASDPPEFEKMKYNGVILTKIGKSLIMINQ
jgi:hypothetical protein